MSGWRDVWLLRCRIWCGFEGTCAWASLLLYRTSLAGAEEKKKAKVGEALAPALGTVQLMKTTSPCSQQGPWFQLSCLDWDRWVVRIHGGAITGYSRWTEKGKKQSCLWIEGIRRARGRWADEIMLPLTVNKLQHRRRHSGQQFWRVKRKVKDYI